MSTTDLTNRLMRLNANGKSARSSSVETIAGNQEDFYDRFVDTRRTIYTPNSLPSF